jgi:hypothetical protein
MEQLHQLPQLANQKLSPGCCASAPDARREQRLLQLLFFQQAAQGAPHLALQSGSGFIESNNRRLLLVNAGTFFSSPSLQRHNTENSKQVFPEKELRGHNLNFHIHVSVNDLYIPTIDLPILLHENMWADPRNI